MSVHSHSSPDNAQSFRVTSSIRQEIAVLPLTSKPRCYRRCSVPHPIDANSREITLSTDVRVPEEEGLFREMFRRKH